MSREDAIDWGKEGRRVSGEWVQLAEIKLSANGEARLGRAIPIVNNWLEEDGRSPFMDSMPKRGKSLRLRYVERGRNLRKLRKRIKAGVVQLRKDMRTGGFDDVIVEGPDWRGDYFQGGFVLERYMPPTPAEDLTERERATLEPVYAQLNTSVDWPWAICAYREDLVTLRVGHVEDCLKCRKLEPVKRSRTRAKQFPKTLASR
jgi:hypothetical protein